MNRRRRELVFVAFLSATACSSPETLMSASGLTYRPLPGLAGDQPGRYVVRASSFAFTTDFELERNDPLIVDLVELRTRVLRTLRLPDRPVVIRVTIFETRQEYEAFLRRQLPQFPLRRAVFVKRNADELMIFACRGESLREDLRHETVHAVLHSVLPQVPIWLDEGLAEYFEPVGPPGIAKPGAIERLKERFSSGRLPRLRDLEDRVDIWQMSQDDYRESWLWVRWCLHHSDATRTALADTLREIGRGIRVRLSDRLAMAERRPEDSVREHLNDLATAESIPTRLIPAPPEP